MEPKKLVDILITQPALAGQFVGCIKNLSEAQATEACIKSPTILDNLDVRSELFKLISPEAWASVLWYSPLCAKRGEGYISRLDPSDKDRICRQHPEISGYLHMGGD